MGSKPTPALSLGYTPEDSECWGISWGQMRKKKRIRRKRGRETQKQENKREEEEETKNPKKKEKRSHAEKSCIVVCHFMRERKSKFCIN